MNFPQRSLFGFKNCILLSLLSFSVILTLRIENGKRRNKTSVFWLQKCISLVFLLLNSFILTL